MAPDNAHLVIGEVTIDTDYSLETRDATAVVAGVFVEPLDARATIMVVVFSIFELVEEVLLLDRVIAVLVICSIGVV